MMSEKDNNLASPDHGYDNDPLNDLVRLLNNEDPFADFSSEKTPRAEDATKRRMPDEVQMQVPQDVASPVEPTWDPAPQEAYGHADADYPAQPYAAEDYVPEDYPPAADDAYGYDEGHVEPRFAEAPSGEPEFNAAPSFAAGEAGYDDYEDDLAAEPAFYEDEVTEGSLEPDFHRHETAGAERAQYDEELLEAEDLRGAEDYDTPAYDAAAEYEEAAYDAPAQEPPAIDDALSRSLAAELEQSYLNTFGEEEEAAEAATAFYAADDGSLSIDEDFLNRYKGTNTAAYSRANYDEPVFEEPIFDSNGGEEEPFDLTASLAESLQASLVRNLEADQAAIEGTDINEATDLDEQPGLYEDQGDGAAEDIFAQDEPPAHETDWSAPAFAATAAGAAAPVAARHGGQGTARNEEQAASILELASQYEREAAAREAAKRAKAEAEAAVPAEQTEKRRKRSVLPLYGGIAAAIVLLAGGGYAFMGGSVSEDGFAPPPIIKADTTAVKSAPEGQEVAEAQDPAGRKLIYDRVSGNETQTQERLVPRQEDVLQVQGANPVAAPVSPDQNLVANAPRRVQSVSIKPDGSIVRTPVAEPQLPTNLPLPAAQAEVAADSDVRVITTSPATEDTTAEPAEADQAPATAEQSPAATPSTDELRSSTETESAANTQTEAAPAAADEQPAESGETPAITLAAAPLPPERTGGSTAAPRQATAPVALQNPVAAAGTPTVDARAALQQAQASTSQSASTPQASGGFVVQLSASRSEQEALTAFSSYQTRFPALANQQPNVQRADLGNRGIYYRLGVGPLASRDAANNLCTQLRSQGLNDCFVRAN